MKKIIILAMAVMMAAGTYANITFNLWYKQAKDHLGTTINDATMFKIIVDADGDGLDAQSSGLNAFASDDDQVAFTYAFDPSYPGEIYMVEDFTNVQRPAVATGTKDFYVAWYEGLTNQSATDPGVGQWYGTYRESDWVFPEDGSTVTFGDMGDNGSALNQSDVTYSQVVPEPASALLVALGGVSVYVLRRHGKRSIS